MVHTVTTLGDISLWFAVVAVGLTLVGALMDGAANRRESQDLLAPRDPSKIG